MIVILNAAAILLLKDRTVTVTRLDADQFFNRLQTPPLPANAR